jgi:hypothetical protein
MDRKSDARERELHDLDVEFVRRHRDQVSHEHAGSSVRRVSNIEPLALGQQQSSAALVCATLRRGREESRTDGSWRELVEGALC